MKPKFVVTGVERGGTKVAAEAFSRLGLRCGHEAIFTPDIERVPSFGSADGDVSWLAAPFLDELPPGTIVLHQLRHPLDVIRSIIARRSVSTKPHAMITARYRLQRRGIRVAAPVSNPDFVRFASRHCPDLFSYPDENTRAAHYWTEWTQLNAAGRSNPELVYREYHVEDLDGSLLFDLCRMLGSSATLKDVEGVLAELGTKTHTGRVVPPVTPQQIADAEVRARLISTAATFGYDLTSAS
ncbi:MAG: hypothetical protein HYX32_14360 [Actinobacteria bacterium]|nr:hypothetical protein [Actinomycetota bacterium]